VKSAYPNVAFCPILALGPNPSKHATSQPAIDSAADAPPIRALAKQALCLELHSDKTVSEDLTVETSQSSLRPALQANSLSQVREKRTMRGTEVQIGNSGMRRQNARRVDKNT
jgi:hypothetical protein